MNFGSKVKISDVDQDKKFRWVMNYKSITSRQSFKKFLTESVNFRIRITDQKNTIGKF